MSDAPNPSHLRLTRGQKTKRLSMNSAGQAASYHIRGNNRGDGGPSRGDQGGAKAEDDRFQERQRAQVTLH